MLDSTAWPLRSVIQLVWWPSVFPVPPLGVDFEGIFPLLVTPLSASLKMQLSSSFGSRPPGTGGSVLEPRLLLYLVLVATLAHKNSASAGSRASIGDRCSQTLPAWTESSHSTSSAPVLVDESTVEDCG